MEKKKKKKENVEQVQKWAFFFWVSALQYDRRAEITGRRKTSSNLLGIQVCKEQSNTEIGTSFLRHDFHITCPLMGITQEPRGYRETQVWFPEEGKKSRMGHTDTIWIFHHKKHGLTVLNSQQLQSPHWGTSHSE